MADIEESIQVTLRVAAALEALNIDYLVGGSIASSVHGRPRTTEDVDMVVRLGSRHVDSLVEALSADFYVDADMIRDAVGRRASFNVIHLESMLKVDMFTFDGSELATEEMKRKVAVPLRGRQIWFASPEDIVLQKLDWYRQGNRVSERQWRDVLGVLSVQGEHLDLAYTRRWAARLDLTELLDQALQAVQQTR